jgi:AAA family ATP:ADP antiporter
MFPSAAPRAALLGGADAPRRPSVAHWLLRFAGDVRPGEAGVVFAMLANLFLLLTGYYVLKTIREPLVLATGGAEMKSYAAAAQAASLLVFVPAYGYVAARVGRLTLVFALTLLFVLQVELFAAGLAVDLPYLGFAFYVWVGIFSLSSIAQFWSYAADVFARDVGERLFPVIAIGATLGSPAGAKLAERLFAAGVAPSSMLHLATGLLLVHLGLYWLIERGLTAARTTPAPVATPLAAQRGGFGLVWSSPFLCWVAFFLLCLNIVNTLGEYMVSRSVLDAATTAVAEGRATTVSAYVGAFYGSYFFWVNVIAVALQSVVAARLVKVAGATGIVLALPIVATGVYGLLAAGVGFSVVRWAKTLENATDYSLMNTGRQLLWLPTSRDEKYKAKQAMDTFFVRAGDLVAAGIVLVAATWLQLDVAGFARLNLGVIVLWLAFGVLALRAYRRLCADCP